MLAVAICVDSTQMLVDLLHFIPAVGNILAWITSTLLSIVTWLTFFIWFKIKGIDFTSGKQATKRLLAFAGGFLAELIPVIDALPAWTFSIIFIYVSTVAEEQIAKTTGVQVNLSSSKTSISAPAQTPASPPRTQNTPLNK